ncbi:patatin-like phospholipase family protein [Candidatus Pacearchaeota archaeon]|nr:patatin-like phospholipase family protein [Candidatus Pacearchaeota archaeon]
MNRVGLVLSGGGARGFAHVGIIKILNELKVKPVCISGCSMGAIIGVLYCLGHDGKNIEKMINELTLKNILRISFSHGGNGSRIETYLNKLFENKNFEDLEIPLYINAVDIESSEEIIFDRGNLAKAVRASIAIPGMFKPAIINNRFLVDGGVKNNIPLQVLLDQKIDKIITVNAGPNKIADSVLETASDEENKRKLPHLSKVLIKSLLIMQSNEHMINYSKDNSDLFIVPDLKTYTLIDFVKHRAIIKIGEKEARKNKKRIERIFKHGKVRTFLNKSVPVKNPINKNKMTLLFNALKGDDFYNSRR